MKTWISLMTIVGIVCLTSMSAACQLLLPIEEWDATTATSTSTGNGGTGGAGGAGSSTTDSVSASESSSSSQSTGSGCSGSDVMCHDMCVDTKSDLMNCGGCDAACTVSKASCDAGTCTGPCGPVPKTGLQICWVYKAQAVPGNQFVGLAGGLADPGAGQTIQTQFNDPRFVNSTAGQGFVLYDLGNAQPDWDIEFRAGLHSAPGNGTLGGTWDCTSSACSGDVYVYQDGKEVGSMVAGVKKGAVSTVPHYDPPYLLNVKVTVPPGT